jgi:hypothetical protein
LDEEQSWGPIFTSITNNFAARVSGVTLNTRFTTTKIVSYGKEDQLYDIAFVSWVFSLIDENQKIKGILQALEHLIRENGYLIITDRYEEKVREKIKNALLNSSGLNLLESSNRRIENCGIDVPEDLKDQFRVRLSGDAAYWVLQKYTPEF